MITEPDPGTARDTSALAVLGLDIGSRWTGACLRWGNEALYGWTAGPRSELGGRDRTALDNPDDVAAVLRYTQRIIDLTEETFKIAQARHGITRIRLATELTIIPIGWRAGKRTKIALVDWLVPREVLVGFCAVYPDTKLIPADKHGRNPAKLYPAALKGRRPVNWGSNETPKGERDHEKAAYDVAGAGARLP